MDNYKMANVIVSGCNGFYYGDWNLSRGVLERQEQRNKQSASKDDRKNREPKTTGICYNDKTESGSSE